MGTSTMEDTTIVVGPPKEPDWDALVPEVTLRPQQHEALSAAFDVLFVQGKRNCIVEAPTGVGKSIIILAMCRYVGSSFMATPQRALQDQMNAWAGLRVMKGKGSYNCTLMGDMSASRAPCSIDAGVREEHQECQVGSCPYFTALEKAKASEMVVHNYASLMAQVHMGRHFGPRSLLALDEGHTAVNWIRNYMTCDFEPSDIQALTSEEPTKKLEVFLAWLKWQLIEIDEVSKNFPDGLKQGLAKMYSHREAFGLKSKDELQQEWNAYAEGGSADRDTLKYKSFESFAKNNLVQSGLVPWTTLWHEPDNWHKEGYWSIIPLKVAPMAGSLLNLGRKTLIVTATALNKTLFCIELGLKDDNTGYVSIDSAFPAENRPVIKQFVGSMSFRNRRRTLPKMIDKLVKISYKHPDEPGIIHTHSHSLAWDIANGLKDRIAGRPIEILPRGAGRDDVINRFLSGALGPAAILIGPAMMEGIDGKDKSLVWQAMCKAPWPHMKDPVIDRLMTHPSKKVRDFASKWYLWKAVQQTVQGLGRVCRSKDDYGITYILDSSFKRILDSGYVPDYVSKSFK